MFNNSIYKALTYLLLFLVFIIGFVLVFNKYYYGTWIPMNLEKKISTIEEFENEGMLVDI